MNLPIVRIPHDSAEVDSRHHHHHHYDFVIVPQAAHSVLPTTADVDARTYMLYVKCMYVCVCNEEKSKSIYDER